jgi:hypothetical protein
VARAKVFINPDAPRLPATPGKVRKDYGKVSRLGDHWIVAVAAALPVPSRMDMHVGYHSHIGVAAYLPHNAEFAAVKFDDPVVKAVRIDVVIIQKPVYGAYTLVHVSKQKRPAFAVTACSATKFVDTLVPDAPVASESRWLAERVAPERSK